MSLGVGAIIRTNTVVVFFIPNGWRFKQATHPILGILVSLRKHAYSNILKILPQKKKKNPDKKF